LLSPSGFLLFSSFFPRFAMNRKEFLKRLISAAGGLTATASLKGSDFRGLLSGPAENEEMFWKLIRDQFVLDPGWTYLNFGGLGSCPLPVMNSFWEWTRSEEMAPSAGHDEKLWWEVKEKLAGLLGTKCRKEDLALVSTATEALNEIINGLPLKSGDEVITSTHEHVAVNVGLLNRMQRDGIVIRLFEPDRKTGLGNVDRISRLINNRTKLILVSHVTCTTGQLFPAKEISVLARDKGIWFALDGAQAPVCVPFDIVDCGVDFYACSTHKWIMGPKRTGFLYVRQGLLDILRPLSVGAGSAERNDIRKNELALHPTAQRYEYGTQNDALFFALGTALDFVRTIGPSRIWAHNHTLAERFYSGLREIQGVEIVSPEEEAYRTAMISFRMKTHDFRKVNEHVAKDRIRVRTVTEGNMDCVRVSFHICNHEGEVTRLLDSLSRLAA
jgi:selenocysteine lyase/cysteine desulfurase